MDEKKKIYFLRKRLLYICTHRGTKELDIILGAYAKKNLMNLSNKQLNELDIILKYNDRSLFLFITTNNTKPPKLIYNKTLKSIILFNKNIKNGY